MRRQLFVIVFVLGAVRPAVAQTSVSYEQQVDQTAVWVGDRFRYSITVTVPPGAHVALEDFERRNINFAPFVLTDTAVSTSTLENGTVRHRFEYVLANYETGNRSVELPRILFRSQPAGEGGVARAATEEIVVPPLPIVVRSTLNQELQDSWIHESLPTSPLPRTRWVFVVLGVLGLLVSSTPAWYWGRARVVEWKARRGRPNWREFVTSWRRSVDELQEVPDTVDLKVRSRSLEALALNYAHDAWAVPNSGLTPEEFRAQLEARQIAPETRDVLGRAIEDAQACRYAQVPSSVMSEDEFQTHVRGLRTLAA